MLSLPACFSALAKYNQFINYKLVKKPNGKTDKIPVSPSGVTVSAHDGVNWLSCGDAFLHAQTNSLGVGFVFTKNDPFFFLDIDSCLTSRGTWSEDAQTLLNRTAGAAVEISQSRTGLHIIGTSRDIIPHSCESPTIKASLFTESRFVALTGVSASGDAGHDCTGILNGLISEHWKPLEIDLIGWTYESVDESDGDKLSDDELIEKALKSESTSNKFGDSVSFNSLWGCDVDVLGKFFPHDQGLKPYDESTADASLAQHLAFWTGNNCQRIEDLMRKSGLAREKYDRPDYLFRTIKRAVSLQKTFYKQPAEVDTSVLDKFGACKLRASSDAQRQFAESIRCGKLAECETEEQAVALAQQPDAKLFIENKDKTAEQILEMLAPVEVLQTVEWSAPKPQLVSGFQYLAADKQIELFDGCVYIQDIHRVFTPKGVLLKSEQFNATYGGYVFQLDDSGRKDTRKPWEAFTESQVVRFPKVDTTCFRPQETPGSIININGQTALNTYVPVKTRTVSGDVSPFLDHVKKLLPDENDRDIILSYMAACVQYPGVKFQWAPLIQGMEGNGKTLLTRCVAFAIGEKYTHLPPAHEITEKFNGWLFDKLFIGVEDIYVPDNKREVLEVLKPMLTGDRLAKREMQQTQVMADTCANFILNSNHKDGIRITDNGRRFAPFFTAQQELDDMERDGMTGSYFSDLYNWLRADGYAIVNGFLQTYKINEEHNPAGKCQRAPATSSTTDAVSSGLGGIEQEILEAIGENRRGFSGGWISSVALDDLLRDIKAQRRMPHNKRGELLKSLGYERHPSLKDGRVNNPIAMDSNKKPRLFIKKGHLAANVKSAAEVSRLYQEAQSFDPDRTNISEKFK